MAAAFASVVADTFAITVLTLVIESKLVLVKPDTAAITVFALVMAAALTEVNTDTAAMFVLLLPILVANAADTVASSALVA